MLIKNKTQKTTFALIGVINTAIDFSILFILKSLGLPAVSANIVSTSAAFCFSFFANKKYTFKTTNQNLKREIFLFIIVTLFGLWVLQSAVIMFVSFLLSPFPLASSFVLLVAKVLATITSLIWNYMMYSRVVFKKSGTA